MHNSTAATNIIPAIPAIYFEVKNPVSAKPTKTLEESIPCLLETDAAINAFHKKRHNLLDCAFWNARKGYLSGVGSSL